MRCVTGSPALLEAARILREEPESVLPRGFPMTRPGALRSGFTQRGNIALVVDEDNEIIPANMNWDDGRAVARVNGNMINAFYGVFDDDYDFVVFFTARNLTGLGAYYSPLINDVTGIGYQHDIPEETFDSFEGRLKLQGIVNMNNYRNYDPRQGGPLAVAMGRMTFNQEVGHRWGTRVRVRMDGRESDELLGRDLSHWSYFAHTANSSMEGNTWIDNGGGVFETRTRPERFGYNSLDLYLMGLLPPEEADEDGLFLIRSPRTGRQIDLQGAPLNRASPPQYAVGDTVVGGARLDVSVWDIIGHEGERQPPAAESPQEFRAAFVLVLRPAHGLNDEDFDAFDEMRRRMAQSFMADTGYRATLHTYLGDRVGLGEACRFGSDCDPDVQGKCAAPVEDEAKACLPVCGDAGECPRGWCCDPEHAFGEALCKPPEYCEPVVDPDAGGAGPDAGGGGGDAGLGEGEGEGEGGDGPCPDDPSACPSEGEGEGGGAGSGGDTSGGGGQGRSSGGCGQAAATWGWTLRLRR